MEKNIVVVSPSNILTDKTIKILNKRNLQIKVIEASQLDAVGVGKELEKEGIKIIISRGNTASVLRENINIPIIDIRHTFFGCYTSYKSAKKISDKIAFFATSKQYELELKKYKLFLKDTVISTINPSMPKDYINKKLDELKGMGIQVVVGGLSLEKIAKEHGFKYIMTSSDGESINSAIDESLHLLKIIEERDEKTIELEKKYEMIGAILNSTSDGIISIDVDGMVKQINENAKKLIKYTYLGNKLNSNILKYFKETLSYGKKINGELIVIENKNLIININPIKVNKSIVGAVATLQNQSEIQDIEQKIRRNIASKGHVAEKTFDDIIGESPQIEEVKTLAKRYSVTDSTILITGETGTGKELFAQSIHNSSKRNNGPFVAINCASFPKSMLESELFGYVKGAFTGALNEGKPGLFELAHNGTIFLDEISEIPIEVQTKLLRVLQERKVMRIGDNKITPINVRIITASNRNLSDMLYNGEFRADFYYRICVLELNLPPLRSRKEDIPILINYFLKNKKLPCHRISGEAINILKQEAFYGNIRQLKNTIERVSIMSEEDIITKGVILREGNNKTYSSNIAIKYDRKESYDAHNILTDIPLNIDKCNHTERDYIRTILCKTKGNREQASHILGISKTTLWRKIKVILKEEPTFLETIKYGF